MIAGTENSRWRSLHLLSKLTAMSSIDVRFCMGGWHWVVRIHGHVMGWRGAAPSGSEYICYRGKAGRSMQDDNDEQQRKTHNHTSR